MIRTGTRGLIFRISVSASIPSMSVMRISIRMTSKASFSTARTASVPSEASATAYPSALKTARSMIRWLSSSSTTRILRFSSMSVPRIHVAVHRQFDQERCSLALSALHADLPPVAFDDLVDNRQPQTGAFTLPAKKGLKNLIEVLRRDAGPGIGDGRQDGGRRAVSAQSEADLPPSLHRFDRIQKE